MRSARKLCLMGTLSFILGFFMAETTLSAGADHVCHGADCPICLHIPGAKQVYLTPILPHHGLPAQRTAPALIPVGLALNRGLCISSVQLKVKLNR
ncbi:MAG: hypothetical protein LBD74_03555 [Spirochaetaceae bacterium]|jgi:membrane associated rhomboid family serine protease|nr:hypothetical protein [Spirochaetaceae bacterium]